MKEQYIKIIMEIISELNPYEDFDENTELIKEGVIDSLSFFALINELEERFDIEIDESEIKTNNFVNVEAILNLVSKYKE